jgi:hypothetical protein
MLEKSVPTLEKNPCDRVSLHAISRKTISRNTGHYPDLVIRKIVANYVIAFYRHQIKMKTGLKLLYLLSLKSP